ncbi:MAG: hypothetical protein NUV67_03055 [archaeon]|nr:hypothetical protein [archaeon]
MSRDSVKDFAINKIPAVLGAYDESRRKFDSFAITSFENASKNALKKAVIKSRYHARYQPKHTPNPRQIMEATTEIRQMLSHAIDEANLSEEKGRRLKAYFYYIMDHGSPSSYARVLSEKFNMTEGAVRTDIHRSLTRVRNTPTLQKYREELGL